MPKTIRKTLVVSDIDPDLKRWLWENYERSGAVIREALREALVRSGEIPNRSTAPPAIPAPAPTASPAAEPEPASSVAPSAPTEAPADRDAQALDADAVQQPEISSEDWFDRLSPDQLKALLEAGRHVLRKDAAPAAVPAASPAPEDPAISQLLNMGFG